MGAKITVHHPKISEGEKNYRMEQIKKAVIRFYKEVENGKRNTNDR